jgi:DNA-binding transcriptional ArsR family regulator
MLNQMVKHSRAAETRLDAVFSALADPTRRAIVAQLADGERSVSELAEPFDVSLPAVTKHLRVLEGAGLLSHRKEGRVRHCRLVAEPMSEVADYIERYRRFWDVRFEALAAHLKRRKEDR